MALKEYRLNGGTHLFDSDNVPEGAELVGDIAESVSPGSFEELVMSTYDRAPTRKTRRKVANKAAAAPENKDDESTDEPSGDDAGDSAE
ncbi:hypothetical protein SEA_FRANKLIN22_6 [Microbacterium phage Franklin22]|uniref:hypothetical protein n=1 Tax=Microbacterium phage Franklin22 TaxID=2894293 RepID=UPI001E72CA54|nr:hypothetical protein QDW15_gp06 [Microbacterium phage Franklin22]UGL61819.1 hypothetical protein SEA_FRANKLIN22_6 [Microbacterium phage Franklin22]